MSLTRRGLLALPAALALPGPLLAQPAERPWPNHSVRVIVPFPPGSTPDTAARAVATHFSHVFGQNFVAENRSGAGGNIGTDAVAKATDGHTIGVTINGPMTTAPALYPNLGYDPARDIAPVSQLVRMPQYLVVRRGLPGADFAGFVAHAKANPGKLSFGSVGPGSAGHLAMEDLMARTGISLLHVPYRGFPPATLDLVAGRIDAMVVSAAAILPQLQAGQVRGLTVTAAARTAQAPEVPTLAEVGLANAESYAWVGLIAPAATPPARIARLAAEAAQALAVPQTRAALEAAGFEVVGSSPAEFAGFITAETARWGGLVRRLDIKPEA